MRRRVLNVKTGRGALTQQHRECAALRKEERAIFTHHDCLKTSERNAQFSQEKKIAPLFK